MLRCLLCVARRQKEEVLLPRRTSQHNPDCVSVLNGLSFIQIKDCYLLAFVYLTRNAVRSGQIPIMKLCINPAQLNTADLQ